MKKEQKEPTFFNSLEVVALSVIFVTISMYTGHLIVNYLYH